MITSGPVIHIVPNAWIRIQDSTRDDVETGGVLLGWRVDGDVFVTQMIEVPDGNARRTSYTRRQRIAQKMLEEVLEDLPENTVTGYVGEWHVHPAPAGPSSVDEREIQRLSEKTLTPLGLVVCARDSLDGHWTPHGLIGLNGRVINSEVRVEEVIANDET